MQHEALGVAHTDAAGASSPYKEGTKRINEMMGSPVLPSALEWTAKSAHCEVLRLVPTSRRLTSRPISIDGRTVHLETCALADETQQRYVEAASAITQRVKSGNRDGDACFGSEPVLRALLRALARVDRHRPRESLTAFLKTNGPTLPVTASMSKIGAPHDILEQLDTYVCRLHDPGKVRAVVEPLLYLLGDARPRDLFPTLFAQKTGKHNEYSDGTVPVWLAMYVLSPMTLPYGDVETLVATALDPRPFNRLIIGSKTIGGAIDAPGPA